jgi:hypothetical protein
MTLLAPALLALVTPAPVHLPSPFDLDPVTPAAWAAQTSAAREFKIQRERWATGGMVLQGFFGVQWLDTIERSGDTSSTDGDDVDQAPVIGGGGQWKLGGKGVDFGIEGMFSFAWRANASAFYFGGGGAAIAVDVDMYLFEIYGGPFVNVFLGDKTRIYGSVGPLVQWADWSEENTSAGIDEEGDGFGSGLYARAGIEFMLPNRAMLGLGVRWADSTIDLGSDYGDLDLSGIQALLTVTTGF